MASVDDEPEAVVIDNGTWMCKAGYAGDKTARVYERTLVGRRLANEDSPQSEYIGEQACLHREFLQLTTPMHRGAVTDWDTMERFWDYICHKELRAGVKDRPMLITEIPGAPKDGRRHMTEILFEKFSIASLYVSNPGFLALLASGRNTGVVLEVGGSVTHATLVVKGSELQQSNRRSDIGGDDVTDWLTSTLKNKGMDFSAPNRRLDVDTFKHHLTSWSVPQQDTSAAHEYSFPGGTNIQLDTEFKSCSDILFRPSMAGLQVPSIDEILHETISSCHSDFLAEICSNIIIAGGGSMFADVDEKMKAALQRRGITHKLKVVAPPERPKSAWLGGSILASLEEFPKLCKSRERYNEHGWKEFLMFDESETVKQASS